MKIVISIIIIINFIVINAQPTDKGFVGYSENGKAIYISNFFDSEATEQTSGIGAEGKTTAEMKTETTYTDAGWDFTNTWMIYRDFFRSEYPTLKVILTDKITIVSGPTRIAHGENVTVEVGYESTDNRDIRFEFRLSEEPFTTYYSDIKNVSIGDGTIQFTFNIPDTILVGTNYEYLAYITNVGGGWDSMLNYKIKKDIEVASAFTDEIISVSGPPRIAQGENITVEVGYEAKLTREVYFAIQIAGAPYTTYYTDKDTVETGKGTIPFIFDVPIDTPVGDNYMYMAVIQPLGGNWNNRLHNMTQKPIEVTLATDVKDKSGLPSDYGLSQNYPNPFNPSTTIGFSIPQKEHVKLSVYNSIGEEVAVLVNGNIESGIHKVNFNGLNLSSGLYFYKISAGSFVKVKKMLLLK